MAAEGTSEKPKDPKPNEGEAPAASVAADAADKTKEATTGIVAPTTGDAPAEAVVDHSMSVYVGNLAWEVTSQDLADHMKSAGLDVKSANVMTSPDGRSKGCGIVELANADVAKQAVENMNDSELKGRQIFVREDRGERKAPVGVSTGGRTYDRFGSSGRGRGRTSAYTGGRGGTPFSASEGSKNRRVYVGNLSWEVAWQDLKDHMMEAGDVVRAEVIKDPSGRSKGCGIVEFANEEGAKNAITTLTDSELKGRQIFVREDREVPKQGGGGGGGRTGGGRGRGGRRFDNNR